MTDLAALPALRDSASTDGRFSVTASRVAYRGAVVELRVDDVVMPGGRTAAREVVEHRNAVAVVALADDGAVVLIEQYRHPLGRRLWELPAGLMDVDGEAPAEAGARELAEETGLAARSWSVLVDLATSPGFSTEMVRVFLATGLTEIGRVIPAGDEESDLRVVRVPLASALAAVRDGTIVNASAVAGILAVAALDPDDRRPVDAPWPP